MKQNKQLTVHSSQLTVRGFSTIWLIMAVAVIGVIAVVAIGKVGKVPSVPQVTIDRQIGELQKLSSSDEIGDIDEDLNKTNLENLDAELGEVDKELQGLR